MPIIVYKEFTATRSGKSTREETCEKCQQKFWYEVEATVQGSGSSPFFLTNEKAKGQAASRADRHLEYALKTIQQPVPCPHCGWYQQAMVKSMLAPRLRGMRLTAWISLFGGSFVILLLDNSLSNHWSKPHYEGRMYVLLAEILLVLFCIGMLMLRGKVVARGDPNRGWTG